MKRQSIKKQGIIAAMTALLMLLVTGCSSASSDQEATAATDDKTSQTRQEGVEELLENGLNEISYTTPGGETGYLYITESILRHPEEKVPMVLMMMSTGGEARDNARTCGWVEKAQQESMIVLAPVYNNYVTYSELAGIVSAVDYVTENYPVDVERIYAAGFSNGGAVSVALASEYPQKFAAISAYGWMVDMRNRDENYDMPFQVIQGTEESTYRTDSGAMAVMEDEQKAIRSLFLFNEMIEDSLQPDYTAAPYWGYAPDDSHMIRPDGREWRVNNFYKEQYDAPFAQLVMIDGAGHEPNTSEADVSWDFFKNFSRPADGTVKELTEPQP